MRKMLVGLAIFSIIASVYIVHSIFIEADNDNLEYIYSLIQQEYGLELSDNIVSSAMCEKVLSRDYACSISIKLQNEHAQYLKNIIRNDESWLLACNNMWIIDTYIEPSLSSFENLSTLKNCYIEADSYVNYTILEENLPFVRDFSLIVVNPTNAEVHYFTTR